MRDTVLYCVLSAEPCLNLTLNLLETEHVMNGDQ